MSQGRISRLVTRVVGPRGDEAQEKGREVNPKLVKRHGIVVHSPDHEYVLHGNQAPAKEDDLLRARIGWNRPAHAHFLDEGPIKVIGITVGKKLEEVGKHPREYVSAEWPKGKPAQPGNIGRLS